MKKILQQKINLGFTLVIAAIIITGITSAAAYSSPGQSPIPLIHESGGDQVIAGLGLGVLPGNNYAAIGNFDLRGPITAALSFFDKSSSGQGFIFSALQNSYFLGKLVIGNTENPDWKIINTQSFFGDDGISFSTPQQKVNVLGNVLSTSLQNTSGQNPVCVEPDGSIVLCDDTTLATTTYSWIVSDWGTCSVSEPSLCSGTYTAIDCSYVISDTTSNGCSPSSPCSSSVNHQNITSAQCEARRQEDIVQKPDSNFGPVVIRNSYNISCSGPTTAGACTSQNSMCTFTAAGESLNERTITCQDQNGNIVSDDLCTEPRPATSRSCLTYLPRIAGDSNSCNPETNRYLPQIDCYFVSSDGTEQLLTGRDIQGCYIGDSLIAVNELRANYVGASC